MHKVSSVPLNLVVTSVLFTLYSKRVKISNVLPVQALLSVCVLSSGFSWMGFVYYSALLSTESFFLNVSTQCHVRFSQPQESCGFFFVVDRPLYVENIYCVFVRSNLNISRRRDRAFQKFILLYIFTHHGNEMTIIGFSITELQDTSSYKTIISSMVKQEK